MSTVQHGLRPAAIEVVLVTDYLLHAGPLELGWSGEERKTYLRHPFCKGSQTRTALAIIRRKTKVTFQLASIIVFGASLVAQLVKNSPAMQEIWVRSLGREDLLEMGKITHSSILAWRIRWTV